MGYALVAQGELERARAVWLENLLAWRDVGNMNHFGAALEGLGFVATRQGDLVRALRLAGAGAGASIRRTHNTLMFPESRVWLERWLPQARASLGEPRATSAWTEGEVMSAPAAVAYALEPNASVLSERSLPTRDRLTRREHEVVGLICRGLTDREIADALVISEHTGHHPVRNILAKLGLQSRVQIAGRMSCRPVHRTRQSGPKNSQRISQV